MRTLINKISQRLSLPGIGVLLSLLAITVILPALSFAWGPDRPTFTEESPADYVTFNSITNNRKWGDERNFMRVRDIASGEMFKDTAALQPGKKYEVIILYHNNAKSTLNAGGTGIAKDAFARTEIPARVTRGSTDTKAMAYVGASNANPTSVYDHISFSNPTQNDISLRYIEGTGKFTSNGAVNGAAISENLFKAGGVKLGYESLNGTLPGCDQYSGYITFTLVADAPSFTFQKDVRLAGTKDWQDSISVNKGDKVEYRLGYKNTGTVEQQAVTMKDTIPQGVNYIAGQTDLINAANPNGKRLGDGIAAGGVNIGSYTPGSNAFLYFFATIDATPCTVLVNTAAVETLNGYIKDTATVKVNGECKQQECKPGVPMGDARCNECVSNPKAGENACALPQTGPAETAATVVALLAITVGVVYYIRSRKDLQDALNKAQGHHKK